MINKSTKLKKLTYVTILTIILIMPIGTANVNQPETMQKSNEANNQRQLQSSLQENDQRPTFTYNNVEYEYGNVPIPLQASNLDEGLPSHLVSHSVVQIDSKEVTRQYANLKSANFQIDLDLIQFSFPASIEKVNMSNFWEVDEKNNFKQANIPQIYHIESLDNGDTGSVFVSETSVRGHFTIDEEIYELKPLYENGKFIATSNYALYKESDIQDLNSYYETSEPADDSSSKIRPHSIKNKDLAIEPDTTYTVHVVRSASNSFYSDHGSNWASELSSIWDGGGNDDPKSALTSELPIYFSIQSTFVFISGGPSSSNAGTFRIEFKNFMNTLSSGDSSYNPDWGWMISGHDFSGSTIGSAYTGSLNYAAPPNSKQFSVNEAKNGAERMVRNSMMHEGGHVMISSIYSPHHDDGETQFTWCLFYNSWYYKATVLFSPYMNIPYCAVLPYIGIHQRIFKFSNTNEDHAEDFIEQAGL